MRKNEFTIANIAGGDERRFRLLDGDISKAAIAHALNIGYGGPAFEGPAGQLARERFENIEDDRLDTSDPLDDFNYVGSRHHY